MKKIYYLIAMAVTAFTFTSCEDVPEPFGQPINPNAKETVVVEPTGSGTEADPYNVAKVTEVTKAMADGEVKNDVYTKGYICQIDEIDTEGTYGNSTYWISDDAEGKSGKYEVYHGVGLGGQKFNEAGATIIKVGDAVIIKGNIKNFKGTTPEYDSGSIIVELNGVKAGGGGSGSGDTGNHGTADAPLTVAQAMALIDAESTIDEAYVKGKISQIDSYNSTYKSITYWISDDGGTTTQLQVYSGKGLNGADFAAKEDLTVGQTVVIKGALKKYNTTYEFDKSSAIISIDGEGGGGTPTPSGNNLLTNGDFETWANDLPTNWKTSSSAGNATLTQSTDAHGGNYSVSVGYSTTANKRLGYKELNLKAGTYTFSFYAKATTADKSQTQAGYVPVTDGTAGQYKYGGYVSLTNTEWTLVSTTFTLDAATTVSLVMMCPKNSDYAVAQNILVDDASLTTSDGGIDGESGSGGSGDAGNHGTADAPLTVAQAMALIDAETTIDEAYVKGKISQIDSYNSTYKSITYWISDDGTTTTQLQVYSGKGLNGADFAAKEDLSVGKTVVIKGKLKKYNTTYEFDKTSSIISIQ